MSLGRGLLLGLCAGAFIVGLFALVRLAYPGTPGLGPTPAPAPAPTADARPIGTPPASVLTPPRPADTSGEWIVDLTGETHCCDTEGRSFPTVYSVTCIPAHEFRADPPVPEESRHYWEIPIPDDHAGRYTTGDPCPKPQP